METTPYSAMAHASFPQFARLPAELRCKIWRRALPRRTVHLRLKMDMDAWNWATEGDWWTHYLVAADPYPIAPPTRALYSDGGRPDADADDDRPALLGVCAEARAEAMHVYRRRLALDPATLQRCLGTAAGGNDDDGAPTAGKGAEEDPRRRVTAPVLLWRMCAVTGAPRFDARRDVLVWTGVRRWCDAGGGSSGRAPGTTGALFEAACRAARYVVVEYDARLDGPLRALARAVAAAAAPLRSLTLQSPAAEAKCAEPYWGGDVRVVAPPARPVVLPTYGYADDDAAEAAAALLRRHGAVLSPAAPPLPDGGFAVLAVVTPAQLAAIAFQPPGVAMVIFMTSAPTRTFAAALTAAQGTDGGPAVPEAGAAPDPETTLPFHGFCLPDYGLP